MAKTFAPASTFKPGETNARAVRTAETTTTTKRGARPSDTSPVPKAGDTAAAAASDTAAGTATDQPAAASESAPRSTRKAAGTKKSAAKKQRVGRHRT